MKRLIVNADDFGRTSGINEGILEAHHRGIVTSATLMVGGSAALAAAQAVSRFPQLGVGLHLCLTGSHPTLPAKQIPSLVDGEGKLPRSPDELKNPDPQDVMAELSNQLRIFFRLLGRLPTHLDTHHHVHRHPVVLEAVIELARRYNLPVRCSTPSIRARLVARGVTTTDSFSDRFYGSEASKSVLLRLLGELSEGTTELMCHPGRLDPELSASSTYTTDRERELQILIDPEVVSEARRLKIQLIHFGEL
jgi:predicted glycoside hydrolase/deacetylase ChbG (UPF0249 family)